MRPEIIYKKAKLAIIDQALTAAVAKKYRKDAGVNIEPVAAEINLSAAMVSYLEGGDRNWTEAVFNKYIAAVDKLRVTQA